MLDLGNMSVEWQNFFLNLFNRVGGTSAPSNSDLVEKSGSLTQIEIRSHGDLQDLEEGDPHPQYMLKEAGQRPIYAGTAIFGGSSGVVCSIGQTLGGVDYRVSVLAEGTGLLNIGEVGVTDKTTTQFKVINTGSEVALSFDWVLVDNN
jgi:hypothetical protein